MRAVPLVLLLLSAACAPTPDPPRGGDAPPGPDTVALPISAREDGGGATGGGEQETDPTRIARLEARARALAEAGGCETEAGCATAPVGSRPCGGPREHLVYCAASTDTAALLATLRELAAVEERHNREQGLVSTCEMRMPPRVALVGGWCRAVEGAPGEEQAPPLR